MGTEHGGSRATWWEGGAARPENRASRAIGICVFVFDDHDDNRRSTRRCPHHGEQ